jgi:hypothetical protein
MQRVLLREGKKKRRKKEKHMSNKKKQINNNSLQCIYNKNLTRPDFVLMTIYTHDSSTLVHELNLISVLDFKFTLSIYNINSTKYSELHFDTKEL